MNDQTRRDPPIDRRTVLKGLCASGVTGLAGCSDLGEPADTDTATGGDDDVVDTIPTEASCDGWSGSRIASRAGTGSDTIAITIYQTAKLRDEYGTHAVDVARSYIEQALEDWGGTVSVTIAPVAMDIQQAIDEEPDRSIQQWFRDFYCCNQFVADGDSDSPSEFMGKDSNYLLTYDRHESASLQDRAWNWVEETYRELDPDNPTYANPLSQDSYDPEFRLWTLVHELGHALPKSGLNSHQSGYSFTVNTPCGDYEYDTPFYFRQGYSENDCGHSVDNPEGDERYFAYKFSDCFISNIAPRSPDTACERCNRGGWSCGDNVAFCDGGRTTSTPDEPTATATDEPTATATDEPTATATDEPTATEPPVTARLTMEQSSPVAGDSITFDASQSEGNSLEYSWTLQETGGDMLDYTTYDTTPQYSTSLSAGDYTINVSVRNRNSSGSDSVTMEFTVAPFEVSIDRTIDGCSYTYRAEPNSSGTPSYEWTVVDTRDESVYATSQENPFDLDVPSGNQFRIELVATYVGYTAEATSDGYCA